MTPELRGLMEEWLASGDPVKVAHAEARIAVAKASGAYPSLATMAASAIKAGAAFVADGLRTVDQAERERRLAICHGCEFYVSEDKRCSKCGCFANLKARLASSHCPIGRW